MPLEPPPRPEAPLTASPGPSGTMPLLVPTRAKRKSAPEPQARDLGDPMRLAPQQWKVRNDRSATLPPPASSPSRSSRRPPLRFTGLICRLAGPVDVPRLPSAKWPDFLTSRGPPLGLSPLPFPLTVSRLGKYSPRIIPRHSGERLAHPSRIGCELLPPSVFPLAASISTLRR